MPEAPRTPAKEFGWQLRWRTLAEVELAERIDNAKHRLRTYGLLFDSNVRSHRDNLPVEVWESLTAVLTAYENSRSESED